MNNFPRLLGDIGGTNARFATQREPDAGLSDFRTLACADYPTLGDAIRHYLAETGTSSLHSGAIGIANPVTQDWVSMTNHHWSFSIRTLQRELGLRRLLVLNDFTALALALPALPADDLVQVGSGTARRGAPIGLIGPGTGLGVSGLIPSGNDYVPLPSEGGHATLAAYNDHETAVIALLRERYGHVSAERALSGPGLAELYRICATLRGVPAESLSAVEVTHRALTNDCPICVAALETFCAMLGTVAANLALILGALGGIYIGGGIVPKLGDFFVRSPFRARFADKGRFSGYMAQIPTYVIHATYPALIGAARALDRPDRESER